VFAEPKPDTWSEDVVQALADVIVLSDDDRRVEVLPN
jgi:hypothetical protein